MIELELHSPNQYFNCRKQPSYIKWVDNAPIKFYSDHNIFDGTGNALMVEPRSILPESYKWLSNNWERFDNIFTHDDELLKLPNAKKILFGNVWDWSDEPKTKLVSMITSKKQFCELHKKRWELANKLQKKIDVFGLDGNWVETKTAHAPYMFAIVIENYIDDWWFTEKICNCFANKVIPIYYGARNINQIFNSNGIIILDSLNKIYEVLADIKRYGEDIYKFSKEAIEDNYIRVKQYEVFEDWFYLTYKDLLIGDKNGKQNT